MELQNIQETDVIICGCGPTGAMLAGYLGSMNVQCIVLEREPEIVTDPRGIVLDEDGIRLVQGLGLYKYVFSDIGACMGKILYVPGVHNDLSKEPFMTFDYSTTEGGTGHVGVIGHKQPVLEKHLRNKLIQEPTVEFRPNSTVVSIQDDEDRVYVDYKDQNGTIYHLRSKYLAAADGKTGYTRKVYLEPKGILMESTTSKYNETWVALNWNIRLPTPETHPDFPLWTLGYSSEEVYDMFFPKDFRFLCNPERPAVCGRFGRPEDRLWRFEFVVAKGEDGVEMSKKENIKKVVFPYITHPGSRYGLSEDIVFPEDCITVLRCRPFRFAARSCNKWALGRVMLCGDAAHVFPPFGGQGIASGFRDASSLAWRLAIACRPNFKSYEKLFEGWYFERKQQLDRSLRMTVESGYFVTESSLVKTLVRDWGFWVVQKIPQVRRWCEKGHRRHGMTRYSYEDGMAFIPKGAGGLFLPQVYCVPLTSNSTVNDMAFTDDIIFDPSKKTIFQVVVLIDKLSEVTEAAAGLADIDEVSKGELADKDATFIVQNPNEVASTQDTLRLTRIATAEEFAKSPLCSGRPFPYYYNEYRMKEDTGGHKYLIVRPDRCIYASCADKKELDDAARSLAELLTGKRRSP